MKKKKEESKEVVISEIYYCGTNDGRTRIVLGLSVENLVTYDLLVCGDTLSRDAKEKLKVLGTPDFCHGENLRILIGTKLLVKEAFEERNGKLNYKCTYLKNLGKMELLKVRTNVFDIRQDNNMTINSLLNFPDIIFKCIFTSEEYAPSFDKGRRPLGYLSFLLEDMIGEENEY